MSDMRLIVAGAGGRMGRTLTRVIAETSGAVVSDVTQNADPDARVRAWLGQDAEAV